MPKINSLFLVDDDLDDLQMFVEALNSVDDSVTISTATDGFDALQKLHHFDAQLPDLVLLDLNMPRMNGKQFLEAVKTSERLRDLPVIIYSTSSNPKDKNDTSALGASDFIVKPLRFIDLCDSIKYILQKDWHTTQS